MRYKLDASGYVCAVSFGCYLDNCTEYTGEIPAGYSTLDGWASTACIQAYYIDQNGNLALNSSRKSELEEKQAQESRNNAPVLRKDIYEVEEVLDSQYVRETKIGKIIFLEDIKTIAPKVKITGIDQYQHSKFSIYTHGKNMLPCDAVSEKKSGVTFTKYMNGSIAITGTADEDIEYMICDGIDKTVFALKKRYKYYLNLGDLDCELLYYDGETMAQQYIGASGIITPAKDVEVTKVVIKIPSGKTVKTTFYPQLEFGDKFTSYESYKCKIVDIDLVDIALEGSMKKLFPSTTLFAKRTLFPGMMISADYVLIENGIISICTDGKESVIGQGAVGLFGAYSTIYATIDVSLEIEYSTNVIDVDSLAFLQGKSTTTNQFKILTDGSIEAHNAFLSGRIEATSGYFKGEVSWENITDKDDVATKKYVEGKGYQNASQVTKITKDTITTSYINALNVTAGYVNAENILGTVISGKTLQASTITGGTITGGTITGATVSGGTLKGTTLSGVSGDFSGKITATSGKIGGFDIEPSAIKWGTSIYFGTDGLKFGSLNKTAEIKSSGDVTFSDLTIKTGGTIGLTSGTITLDIKGDSIKFSGAYATDIQDDKVSVYNTHMDKDGFSVKSASNSNYYTDISLHEIAFGSASTVATIKKGTTTMLSFSDGKTTISSNAVIGASGKTVGFFGGSGSAKKTVSTITSTTSATASTVATKVNDLINALKAYNLV